LYLTGVAHGTVSVVINNITYGVIQTQISRAEEKVLVDNRKLRKEGSSLPTSLQVDVA